MRIKDIPSQNRPRERLRTYGEAALSDAELLAIILQKGTQQENAIDISNKILSQYGLQKLASLSLHELQQMNGIGPVKASLLVAIFAFTKRYAAAQCERTHITNAQDVFSYMAPRLPVPDKEVFVVLHMNAKNRVVKEEVVSLGILNASLIHPREVFKAAIREGAYAIILVHNHPSGDATPSEEDLAITEKLIAAGELVDIPVLDHVIVGSKTYWSWSER